VKLGTPDFLLVGNAIQLTIACTLFSGNKRKRETGLLPAPFSYGSR
jgi:hypothetical protein